MSSVHIIYGFCEGPALGGQFVAALQRAGYTMTNNATQADIIIAHSGGCFLIPVDTQATRIIYIAPAYWPNKTILWATWQKWTNDLRAHYAAGTMGYWLKKTGWNLIYLWNIPRNQRMLNSHKTGKLWPHGKEAIVIRPSEDTFCTPQLDLLPFADPPQAITIPGHQHDDCWQKCAPYIAAVQS